MKLHIVKDIMVVFREVFFIHPSSVPSSIHGQHHIVKKTLVEINNPPLSAHVLLSRKGVLSLRVLSRDWVSVSLKRKSSERTMLTYVCSYSCSSGICDDNQQESRLDIEQRWGIFVVSNLLSWSTICCYLIGHKQM